MISVKFPSFYELLFLLLGTGTNSVGCVLYLFPIGVAYEGKTVFAAFDYSISAVSIFSEAAVENFFAFFGFFLQNNRRKGRSRAFFCLF